MPARFAASVSVGGNDGVPRSGDATWHPTVVYLLLLCIAEAVAYGYLRYAFRTAHGG